jgi:general secretion pathway protein G
MTSPSSKADFKLKSRHSHPIFANRSIVVKPDLPRKSTNRISRQWLNGSRLKSATIKPINIAKEIQAMVHTRHNRKGFTLIEILIVVIILGILAAIVIPQFTNASTAAKASSLSTSGQTLRSQVAYYKLQHGDKLPGTGSGTTFSGAQFWTDMTTQTDGTGAAWTGSAANTTAGGPYGPYMQSIPNNNINGASTVVNASVLPGSTVTTVCGFEYDWGTSATPGTGRAYGTGTDYLTAQP